MKYYFKLWNTDYYPYFIRISFIIIDKRNWQQTKCTRMLQWHSVLSLLPYSKPALIRKNARRYYLHDTLYVSVNRIYFFCNRCHKSFSQLRYKYLHRSYLEFLLPGRICWTCLCQRQTPVLIPQKYGVWVENFVKLVLDLRPVIQI